MGARHDEVPPVLEEVHHRRVWKVVAAYLAVAFGALEATAVVLPLMVVPEWTGRAVLGTFVLGFPVAVVLAWTYDITPKGVVRTPDDLSPVSDGPPSRAWLLITVLGIGAGVLLRMMRG